MPLHPSALSFEGRIPTAPEFDIEGDLHHSMIKDDLPLALSFPDVRFGLEMHNPVVLLWVSGGVIPKPLTCVHRLAAAPSCTVFWLYLTRVFGACKTVPRPQGRCGSGEIRCQEVFWRV